MKLYDPDVSEANLEKVFVGDYEDAPDPVKRLFAVMYVDVALKMSHYTMTKLTKQHEKITRDAYLDAFSVADAAFVLVSVKLQSDHLAGRPIPEEKKRSKKDRDKQGRKEAVEVDGTTRTEGEASPGSEKEKEGSPIVDDTAGDAGKENSEGGSDGKSTQGTTKAKTTNTQETTTGKAKGRPRWKDSIDNNWDKFNFYCNKEMGRRDFVKKCGISGKGVLGWYEAALAIINKKAEIHCGIDSGEDEAGDKGSLGVGNQNESSLDDSGDEAWMQQACGPPTSV